MKKLLTFSLALLFVAVAFGQTKKTWVGGAAGCWTNPAAWSPAGVPGAGAWIEFNGKFGIGAGGVVEVSNVPWHNAKPMWAGAPGNTGFDLGYITIKGATTVRLHGGNGAACPGTPMNVELRFSGPLPSAGGVVDKNFWITGQSSLDLTNPDGSKVAIDLAPRTYSQVDAGSQVQNGYPFEYLLNPPATVPYSVHAFKLESDCGNKNVAFKQLDGNAIQNVFVQISLCAKDMWHMYSPPTYPSVLCCTFKTDYVFEYDNSIVSPANPWVRVPDPLPYNTNIGQGYEVWDPSGVADPAIWECSCPPSLGATYSSYHVFNGTLNNYRSRQSWTLFGGNSGWEFIGNPYADAIKIPFTPGWTGAKSTSPNPHTLGLPGHPVNWYWESTLNPHLQMWNHLVGNYTFWDFRFATGTALNYPAGNSPEVIPAMQGFFVERNATFMSGANNLEVGQLAQMDHIYTDQIKEEGVVENFLKLTVNGNDGSDQTGVVFMENAIASYDMNDGRKLFGDVKSPQLYSLTSDNEIVTFNMLPLGNNSVPVNLQVGSNGNYSINADFVSSFSPNAEIILTDKLENVSQDLRLNPDYNFTAKVDDDANRFMLFFSNLLAVNNVNESISKVWAVGSDVFVQMKDQNNIGSVMVYDMTGKKVMEKNLENGIMTQLKTNLVNGIYVVSIVTNKGSYNQKVFIN